MKATRDIGRALGFRRSGRTDSGPCTACGDPGFTAQDPDGRTLVTCHTGGSDQNDVRAALPEHGRWGNTAGSDRASRTPSHSVHNQSSDAESKRHAALTLWQGLAAPASPPDPATHE